VLGGLAVTSGFDGLLRRTSVSVANSSSNLVSTSYGYDGASRLLTVSGGAISAT